MKPFFRRCKYSMISLQTDSLDFPSDFDKFLKFAYLACNLTFSLFVQEGGISEWLRIFRRRCGAMAAIWFRPR